MPPAGAFLSRARLFSPADSFPDKLERGRACVRACACLENWVAGAKLNHNRLLLAQYRNNGNTNLKLNLFPFVHVNCATAGSEREQGELVWLRGISDAQHS